MKCLLGGHPALLRTFHLQFPVELRVSFMTAGLMEGSFRDHRLGFFYHLFFFRFITHCFGFGTLLGICFGSLSIEIAVENVYWEGEDDGGVLFCRYGVQCLQDMFVMGNRNSSGSARQDCLGVYKQFMACKTRLLGGIEIVQGLQDKIVMGNINSLGSARQDCYGEYKQFRTCKT